jgi:hypothetical protein
LTGGLVAGSGEFFPQGRVCLNGSEALFDAVVGAGWCIVASEPGVLDDLTAAHRDAWNAIGGKTAVITQPPTAGAIEDVDGAYRAWFAAHSCLAAVVRPDWYLYGTARSSRELTELLDGLKGSFRR